MGVTILMVSHDVVFCAEYVHRCGMFFDGQIIADGTPAKFFSGNSYYTTPANRMARHLLPDAVTIGDVIAACGGVTEEAVVPSDTEFVPLPKPEPRCVNAKPAPLPWWRKLLAGVSALAALAVFFYATSVSDLSAIVNASGITAAGGTQLLLYLPLFLSLTVFFILRTDIIIWSRFL